MKKGGKTKHTKRNIVLLAFLAVLCIGGAELTFCRYFEPALYERIVSPVRYAAVVVVDTGRAGLNATGRFLYDAGSAAGRFFQGVGKSIADFAVRTGEQATALWENLTAPKATAEPEDPSELPEPSGLPEISGGPVSSVPLPTETPLTELLVVDGRQILTGGSVDITYFCQSDTRWADLPFGADTIGLYGCGPTAMAIAVASLTDTDTDPAVMAAWAAEQGYWAPGAGSYLSIVIGTARSYGLMAETFPSRDVNDLLDALSHGKVLIALMGPGQFTTGGHFILLRGVTMSGQVLIADPNSPENSLTSWDPQVILDELSLTQSSGSPLWALWTPD